MYNIVIIYKAIAMRGLIRKNRGEREDRREKLRK